MKIHRIQLTVHARSVKATASKAMQKMKEWNRVLGPAPRTVKYIYYIGHPMIVGGNQDNEKLFSDVLLCS